MVCVAATSQTNGQCEYGTLNADAGASSMVLVNMTARSFGEAVPPTSNRGLINAHSGTSPTQAEVGLLTRNVKIRSTFASSLRTYWYCAPLSTVTASWCEFYRFGINTTNKHGLDIDAGATANAKSFSYCSLHDSNFAGFFFLGSSTSTNTTISNCVIWNWNLGAAISFFAAVSGTDWTIDSNLIMGGL